MFESEDLIILGFEVSDGGDNIIDVGERNCGFGAEGGFGDLAMSFGAEMGEPRIVLWQLWIGRVTREDDFGYAETVGGAED